MAAGSGGTPPSSRGWNMLAHVDRSRRVEATRLAENTPLASLGVLQRHALEARRKRRAALRAAKAREREAREEAAEHEDEDEAAAAMGNDEAGAGEEDNEGGGGGGGGGDDDDDDDDETRFLLDDFAADADADAERPGSTSLDETAPMETGHRSHHDGAPAPTDLVMHDAATATSSSDDDDDDDDPDVVVDGDLLCEVRIVPWESAVLEALEAEDDESVPATKQTPKQPTKAEQPTKISFYSGGPKPRAQQPRVERAASEQPRTQVVKLESLIAKDARPLSDVQRDPDWDSDPVADAAWLALIQLLPTETHDVFAEVRKASATAAATSQRARAATAPPQSTLAIGAAAVPPQSSTAIGAGPDHPPARLPYQRRAPGDDGSAYAAALHVLLRLDGWTISGAKAPPPQNKLSPYPNIFLRHTDVLELALTRAFQTAPSAVLLDPNDAKQVFNAISPGELQPYAVHDVARWTAQLHHAIAVTPAIVRAPQPNRTGNAHPQVASHAATFRESKRMLQLEPHSPRPERPNEAPVILDAKLNDAGTTLVCVPDFILALGNAPLYITLPQRRKEIQGAPDLTGGSEAPRTRLSSEGSAPSAVHCAKAALLEFVNWHLPPHALLLWHRPRFPLVPPPLPQEVKHPSVELGSRKSIDLFFCSMAGEKTYIPAADLNKSLLDLWKERPNAMEGRRQRNRSAVATFEAVHESLKELKQRIKEKAPVHYPQVKKDLNLKTAGVRFYLRPTAKASFQVNLKLANQKVTSTRMKPTPLNALKSLRELSEDEHNVYPQMHVYVVFTNVMPLRASMRRTPPASESQCPPLAFTKQRELSLCDEPCGDSFVVEHVVEERPPLIPNLGMGAKIVTYHRRSAAVQSAVAKNAAETGYPNPNQEEEEQLPPVDVAPGHVVTLAESDPGPLLGVVKPGASVPCFETTLARHTYHRHGGIAARAAATMAAERAAAADAAVAAKEAEWDAQMEADGDDDGEADDTAPVPLVENANADAHAAREAVELTDFLLIRRPDGTYYLREVDQAASLGQSQPMERPAIPEPDTEVAAAAYASMLKAYTYREFRKQHEARSKKRSGGKTAGEDGDDFIKIKVNALIRNFPWLCNKQTKHYDRIELEPGETFFTRKLERSAVGKRDEQLKGITLDLTETRSLVTKDLGRYIELPEEHVLAEYREYPTYFGDELRLITKIFKGDNAIDDTPHDSKEERIDFGLYFKKSADFRLRDDAEIRSTCSVEDVCALEAMRAGIMHLRSMGVRQLHVVPVNDVRRYRALLPGVLPLSQWSARPCPASTTSPEVPAAPRRLMANRQRLPVPKAAHPIPKHLRAARRIEEALHTSPWNWVAQYREVWFDRRGLFKVSGYGSEAHPSFGRPHVFNLLKAWIASRAAGGGAMVLTQSQRDAQALEPGSCGASKDALTAMHLVAGDAYAAAIAGPSSAQADAKAAPPPRVRKSAKQKTAEAEAAAAVAHAPLPPATQDEGKDKAAAGEGGGGDASGGKERETKAVTFKTSTKTQLKVPERIQDSDADLRRISMEDAAKHLRNFGLDDETIKSMKRWDRIAAIRQLSTAAALDGGQLASKVGRFVREKRVSQSEQIAQQLKALDSVFTKQRYCLDRTDPPPPLPTSEPPDEDKVDAAAAARNKAAEAEAEERAALEALRASLQGGVAAASAAPTRTEPMIATERIIRTVTLRRDADRRTGDEPDEPHDPSKPPPLQPKRADVETYEIYAPSVVADLRLQDRTLKVRSVVERSDGTKIAVSALRLTHQPEVTAGGLMGSKGVMRMGQFLKPSKSGAGAGAAAGAGARKAGSSKPSNKRLREGDEADEDDFDRGAAGDEQPRKKISLSLSLGKEARASYAQLKEQGLKRTASKAKTEAEMVEYAKTYAAPGAGRLTNRQRTKGTSGEYEKALKEFNDLLLGIAKAVATHTDVNSSGHQVKMFDTFDKPVPTKTGKHALLDYNKFVTHPMCLQKIKERCEKKEYNSMTAFDADFAAIAAAAHAYHDNKEAKAAVPVIAEWADRMVEHARKTIENNSAMLNQCLYYLQKEQTIEGGDNGGGVEEAPAVAVAPPSVPERAAAPGGGAEDAGGVAPPSVHELAAAPEPMAMDRAGAGADGEGGDGGGGAGGATQPALPKTEG